MVMQEPCNGASLVFTARYTFYRAICLPVRL